MLNAGGKKYRIYFLEILLDEDPYMLCSLSHSRIWKKVLISFLVGPKLVFLSFSSGHVDGSAGIPTKRYDAASQWQWCHSEASTGSSTLDQILVSRLELSRWIYFPPKKVLETVSQFFPLAMLTTDADAVLPLVLHDCERRSFWTLPLHLNISSSIGVQNCGCEVRMRRVHKKELKILNPNHVEPYPVL